MDVSKFDEILNINDKDFAEKFMAALGVKAGETVELITPQFNREDGITPSFPDSWHCLKTLPRETLKAIGCRAWDEPDDDGNVLMLFPAEWYPYIPDGLEIVDINGETEKFEKDKTDDDKRGGCLAYGVEVAA